MKRVEGGGATKWASCYVYIIPSTYTGQNYKIDLPQIEHKKTGIPMSDEFKELIKELKM